VDNNNSGWMFIRAQEEAEEEDDEDDEDSGEGVGLERSEVTAVYRPHL